MGHDVFFVPPVTLALAVISAFISALIAPLELVAYVELAVVSVGSTT